MTNELKGHAEAMLERNGFKRAASAAGTTLGVDTSGTMAKWHCTDGEAHMDVVFFRTSESSPWSWDVRTQTLGTHYSDLLDVVQGTGGRHA